MKSGMYIIAKEGKNIDYFKKNRNRKCSLNGERVTWMLRIPETYYSSAVCVFTWDDKISIQNAYEKAGIRPAFCIDSSTKVSYEGNGGGRFVIMHDGPESTGEE